MKNIITSNPNSHTTLSNTKQNLPKKNKHMEKKPSSNMSIEVTIISAEGLLMTKTQPVKKDAYVVVRSDPFNSGSTGTDKEGGGYPVWNEKMVIEVPVNARHVTVEAYSGSRAVGAANVPVTDFSGGFLPENYLSFLSYRLRDCYGEKNGIVNFSVKVIRGAARGGGGGGCSGRSWGGAPMVDGKVLGHHGVVTGIPVSYKY